MVLNTLGKGATGKVKLGVDLQTGERVALKLMEIRTASHRQMDQINREIAAMRTLQHGNVLALRHVDLDVWYPKVRTGTNKHVIVLVIELAQGGELFDFMMYTGAFSEGVAKSYARQLLSALATCHACGIYHRDLKPENLLLGGNFQLKVADFGYSAVQTGNCAPTLLHTECGTRSYMSPEVISHQAYLGGPSDIWSAGVVCFIMLCGNPPFQLAQRGDWWFDAIAANQPDRFWKAHLRSCPNISVEGRAFLLKMLRPDPSSRATIAELCADPWLCGSAGGVAPSDGDLASVMLSKKRSVDGAKAEEREKAARAAAEARAAAASSRMGAGQTFDPAMMQQRVRRGGGGECGSGDGTGDGDAVSYRSSSSSSPAPPLDESSFARLPILPAEEDAQCYSQLWLPDAFGSRLAAGGIAGLSLVDYAETGTTKKDRLAYAIEALSGVLRDVGVPVSKVVDGGLKIVAKGETTGDFADLELQLKLYRVEQNGRNKVLALIARRGGDMFKFREFFAKISEAVDLDSSKGEDLGQRNHDEPLEMI